MIFHWLNALMAAGIVAFVLFVPGFAIGRTIGVRGFLLAAISPAITLAVVGFSGIFFARVHLSWNWISVLLLISSIVAITLIISAARRHLRGRVQVGMEKNEKPRWKCKFELVELGRNNWLTAIVGLIVGSAPYIVGADPQVPPQKWDASYHLNVVRVIMDSGNGSTLSAATAVYGPDQASSVYYPTLWHQVVSAAAIEPSRLVLTANASSLVIIAIWVFGITALCAVALAPLGKMAHYATLAAPIFAGANMAFPADQLTSSQWPNMLSLSATPGILAFTILLLRLFISRITSANSGAKYSYPTLALGFVIAATGGLGAIMTHAAALFNALVILVPVLLTGTIQLCVHLWRKGQRIVSVVFFTVTTAVLLGLVWVLMTNPRVAAAGTFHWAPKTGFKDAVIIAVAALPTFPMTFGMRIWIGATTLALLLGAAWALWKKPKWLAISWAFFMLLVVVSHGPDTPLRFLARPWYTDSRRISSAAQIPATVLVSLGFALAVAVFAYAVSRYFKEASGIIATIAMTCALIISLGAGGSAKARIYSELHGLTPLVGENMVDKNELEWFRNEAAKIVPTDGLVLSDPGNGSVYLYTYAGRKLVNPQLSSTGGSKELNWLNNRFKEIHKTPLVCEVLKSRNIKYFYYRPDRLYSIVERSYFYPGMYNIDLSRGFEPIAHVGQATLYKITACDK